MRIDQFDDEDLFREMIERTLTYGDPVSGYLHRQDENCSVYQINGIFFEFVDGRFVDVHPVAPSGIVG